MGTLIKPAAYTWQHRAVKHTGGNQTLLGCFVLAILGWQHGRKPPRFGSTAKIDDQGFIITHVQGADGKITPNCTLGPLRNVIDEFRRLADDLKLSDEDRTAMFGELQKWFIHDARANQTNEERGLQT